VFLPQSEKPSFAPIQHNWRSHSFMYAELNVKFIQIAVT
jgi:hypothetical protein